MVEMCFAVQISVLYDVEIFLTNRISFSLLFIVIMS